ncbi:MAG: CpsD/CapB family tyrosine-protein kinase [Ruminococcaceae bacterium]|nr:CpsD/CapB family tyrosine-protein kinase [Oscillospiraceae bacterium]
MALFKRKKIRHKKGAASSYVKSELLTEESPFIITEAYKAMRTNLMFMLSGGDSPRKVVAFTSSMANEGKTTTCLNMAIAFAQTGKKTLIIDMDMRRPRVHRYFEIPSSPGLSDRLGDFTKQIPVSKTEYENLYVLPVGTIPPSPPELLMSSTFDTIMEELREQYDYVFIDTPPIHVVTDLAIIAAKLDGVVFIVRENTVSLDIVKQSVESLKRVDAKILGFIMNDSKGDALFTQYKYRRKYKTRYGYSYGYSFPKE